MNVFVDTNVLLDVLFHREPHYRPSAEIWTRSELGAMNGMISVISFNNIYYVLCRAADRERARASIRLLRNVFQPVALGAQIINQAIDSKISDFEDAIQYTSAIRSGSEFLITRNVRDYPKTGIPVILPEEFLALD